MVLDTFLVAMCSGILILGSVLGLREGRATRQGDPPQDSRQDPPPPSPLEPDSGGPDEPPGPGEGPPTTLSRARKKKTKKTDDPGPITPPTTTTEATTTDTTTPSPTPGGPPTLNGDGQNNVPPPDTSLELNGPDEPPGPSTDSENQTPTPVGGSPPGSTGSPGPGSSAGAVNTDPPSPRTSPASTTLGIGFSPTKTRATKPRTHRATISRVSYLEPCNNMLQYCLLAYETGELCGRSLYYRYRDFRSYCTLDYVNCMHGYEVWMVAYMGNCFDPEVKKQFTDYPTDYDDTWLHSQILPDV